MLTNLPVIKNYIKSERRSWVAISINNMGEQSYVTVTRFDGHMEQSMEIPVRYENSAKWLAAHIYNSYKNWATMVTVEDILAPKPEQPAPDDTQRPEIGIDMQLKGTKHDVLNDFAAMAMLLRNVEITPGTVEGLKTGTAKINIP